MGLYYGLDVAVFGNVRCGDSESNIGGLQPDHEPGMQIFVAAAAVLASLHHCSLLSPHVAAPAAFLVGATM